MQPWCPKSPTSYASPLYLGVRQKGEGMDGQLETKKMHHLELLFS